MFTCAANPIAGLNKPTAFRALVAKMSSRNRENDERMVTFARFLLVIILPTENLQALEKACLLFIQRDLTDSTL